MPKQVRTILFKMKEDAYRRGDMKQYQLVLQMLRDDNLIQRLDLILADTEQKKPS
jgi:hypothetical protein